MARSLVGKVRNEKFAFFWLLIGGSIGNILLILHFLALWLVFLPSAILSILIAIAILGKTRRPKIWLGADLLLTIILLIILVWSLGANQISLSFLPDVLLVLGCVLGIMNW